MTDRVHIVRGGTRGLGFATAQALTAEGARVVVSGRNTDALATAVTALGAQQATGVAVDNADPTCPQRLVGAALDRWNRLDGALVNGGGTPAGIDAELPDDGALAFVLSTSAPVAISGLAMPARTVVTRLGGRGIRVNALLPGRILTVCTSYVDAGAVTSAVIPLGHSGESKEFGRVAAFVLSPAASCPSGAMIPVDGGASA